MTQSTTATAQPTEVSWRPTGLRNGVLEAPLGWRRPRRATVSEDLFRDDVPDDAIAGVFAVMSLAHQHTFRLLTQHPDRMRSLLTCDRFWLDVSVARMLRTDTVLAGVSPLRLPNVWLGVSIVDQAEADRRVPDLLATPAAVRWVSCTPTGPIDLSAWMLPRTPMRADDAPKTWAQWTWPDWVPTELRADIQSSWSDEFHSGPQDWIRNARAQNAPAFGQTWTTPDGRYPPMWKNLTGRYVHAWNTGGRLVLPNGQIGYTAFTHDSVRDQLGVHWLVVGGQTGRGAEPMLPQWLRGLRDQALAAGVPLLFTQWGEWAPFVSGVAPGRPIRSYPGDMVQRVGRKAAGRELDGRTWDQYPTPVPGAGVNPDTVKETAHADR